VLVVTIACSTEPVSNVTINTNNYYGKDVSGPLGVGVVFPKVGNDSIKG
jgi:hypothetical protein